MSEPTPTDTTPTEPTETVTEPTDTTTDPAPEPTPNSEAARYRVQLRETEATLATTTERLATYQRRAAEGLVAGILDNPGDMWDIGGVDPSTFIDPDTGELQEDDLLGAAAALVDQRPKLGKNYRQFGSGLPQHTNWGQNNEPPPGKVGWSQVLGNG